MPAYIRHGDEQGLAPIVCPGCLGILPMLVREIEPHWNSARIDLVYECADCGAEVRHSVHRPALRH